MIDIRASRSFSLKDAFMMGLFAIGSGSCLPSSNDVQRPPDDYRTPFIPQIVPTPTTLTQATLPPSTRLEQFIYAPGVRSPRSSDGFQVGTSNVEWINYSNFNINPQVLKDYYNFLAQLPGMLPEIDLNIMGQESRFKIVARPNIARRIYFINPTDPVPSWKSDLPQDFGGYTRQLNRTDGLQETVSLIQMYPNQIFLQGDKVTILNINRVNEGILMTEACQTAIQTLGQARRQNDLAQETFCNTLGYLTAFGEAGLNYAQAMSQINSFGILELRGEQIKLSDKVPPSIFMRFPRSRLAA